MPFWLGKPGFLVQLPQPLKGIGPTAERAYSAKATIGGGRATSRAPGAGRRTYDFSWLHLDPEVVTTLEEFYTGARGPAPFALLDPWRRNFLTANQSGATSVDNDPGGFTVPADSGELVTSNPDTYSRGPRSLRWTLPATVTSGVLQFDPPSGLVGVPAPTGQPWTFSGVVSTTGLAPSVTVTPALSWRRLDGSELSTTLGTPVAAVLGAWTSFSVSAAAPPAGAVAVVAQLRVAPGVLSTAAGINLAPVVVRAPTPARPPASWSVGPSSSGRVLVVDNSRVPPAGYSWAERSPVTSTDVLVDYPQLEMNATARTWLMGTGVPLLSMVAMPESYTILPYHTCSATFVEVG